MLLTAPGTLASPRFRPVAITGLQSQLSVASDTRSVLIPVLLARTRDQSGQLTPVNLGLSLGFLFLFPSSFSPTLFSPSLTFFWGVRWGDGQSNVLPLIYTTTLCPQFKTQSSISQELPWSWEKPGPISTNASALGCHLIINNKNGSLSSGPGDS